MKKIIKIANGQGFWGDSIDAPYNLIKYGDIDYLTLDYLAEVTLSIMQRQKLKNPNKGYATDFIDLINKEFKPYNNIVIKHDKYFLQRHKISKDNLLENLKNFRIFNIGDKLFERT